MVHFVGAGPGAPDLITRRGAALLADADCIIYAGSLVNPALLGLAKPGCAIYNSAEMTLEQVLDTIRAAEKAGGTTVRLHTGDPCLYGAIREQMDALDADGIPYDDTPGVSSFCGAADRPVGVCGLDGVLDALDVRCAAVVEGGAEADDQDLLVADVVLVAGVVLRGVAGVAAKVLGACLFALDHLLLSVGQSVPCCLCSLTLRVGILVALLHIDGVDEVCYVLCCHFISLLAAYFAGGGGACGGAAGGSGRRCTAAGEDTGTQGQCGGSGGDALPVLVGCLTHCLSPFCLCGMYFSVCFEFRPLRVIIFSVK